MINLSDKETAELAALGGKLSEIFGNLSEVPGLPEHLRYRAGEDAARVLALSDANHVYNALTVVEDGYTPDANHIEHLRTGLYHAELLQLDRDRIRAALKAGAERRLAGG